MNTTAASLFRAAGLAVGLATAFAGATLRAQERLHIALNSVGYLPAAAKVATIHADDESYRIERIDDAKTAFEGKVSPAPSPAGHVETLRLADFSDLREPGEYRLAIGDQEPVAFRIAEDVYREPFVLAVRAMYLWRCGSAVSAEHRGQRFSHGPCHRDDGYLDVVVGKRQRKPSVGGWHDAGDYNKYVVNAGATVGVMFRAWEDFGTQIQKSSLKIPGEGQLPEFLAEIKWELDWLLTMQAHDGSVYHKLSTKDFGGFIPPEQEHELRYFAPWSSAATADFIALTAMAARHFAPYDRAYADRCLAAAKKSYAFLKSHPAEQRPDLRAFSTGGYDAPDPDDRLWAVAELWETTGDVDLLAELEARLRPGDSQPAAADVDWDWPNLKNLGLLTYLFSKRAGRDQALVDEVQRGVLRAADEMVKTADEHDYARPLGERYYWGCNGSVARQSLLLHAASRLTGEPKYRDTSLDALNHLFGRNCYGRSFVTGVGHRPPMHPHDRRSGSDDIAEPWPGYLVGGPHPLATDWRDAEEDYRTNEIAINWNGALIYALAAHLE